MGGSSFRCPLCTAWFISKHALHGHLGSAKHRLKNFEVQGTGPNTIVIQLGEQDATTQS